MYKLKISEKWYTQAVKSGEHCVELSAGSALNNDLFDMNVEPHEKEFKHGLLLLMKNLRVDKQYSIDKLARKIDVEKEQLLAIESDPSFRPPPRTIMKLADFYNIPFTAMSNLVGAVSTKTEIKENIVRYAAASDSFEKLTKEEKKELNKIVDVIRKFK